MTFRKRGRSLLLASFVLLVLLPFTPSLNAATEAELKEEIADRNSKIADLEKEIAQYQAQLDQVGKQKQTLQSAVATLDLSVKKLSADIRVTQNRIDTTNLEIQRLALDIKGKTARINESRAGLGESLRTMEQTEEEPFVVTLFAHERLSDFLDTLATLQSYQVSLRDNVDELQTLKESLEDRKVQTEKKKKELVLYQSQLNNQKKSLDINRAEKNKLLAETKNTEANYQKLLNQKVALRKQFEQDLFNLESDLKSLVDPGALPDASEGILAWPVDVVRITQYFGNTDFATKNPQIYSGKGHNGIDLGIPIGTPIKAAGAGVIVATGNTDLVCPNASYGKWILVRHPNGLSTLYAHLSTISVTAGQGVSLRQVIGFSGNTGYATGPHLHFVVYATQGVEVTSLKSKVCNGTYTLPIASLNAYLNPMSYL